MIWILSLISILLVMIIAGPLVAYSSAFSQTQNNTAAASANSGGMSTKSVEIAKSGSKNLIVNSTGGANNTAASANSGGMSTKSVEIAKSGSNLIVNSTGGANNTAASANSGGMSTKSVEIAKGSH